MLEILKNNHFEHLKKFDEENIQDTLSSLIETKNSFFLTEVYSVQHDDINDPSHVNALAYLELLDRTIDYARAKRDRYDDRRMHEQGLY